MPVETTVGRLTRAAGNLEILPRADRWAHLSLCVLDAVFSIGAKYGGVVRVCREYARHAGLTVYLVPHRELSTAIGTGLEQPLDSLVTDIRAVGAATFAADVVRHRGRTSTRHGILKADAALRYAQTLLDHDVHNLPDISALLADPARLSAVESDLRQVPGNGFGDVRLGYLWMVAGDDHQVKPDRMVLRWLARHTGQIIGPTPARNLIVATAEALGCTPWELDHAIWRTESGRSTARV